MTQEDVVGRAVDALRRLDVTYMVTGSFASNLHGVPRMTQDADVVVDLDEASAAKLVALLEAEFYVSKDAALEAVRRRRMFNAIHLESGFKIDLVVTKERPFAAEELRRREPSLLGRRERFGR
ncbi:MAG: hypothetical protein ACRD2Z_10270 [Thermoanaerobaculia bacterium]